MGKKCFLILIFFLLSGCTCEEKELIRTTSPDGKLDAVLIRENCGGATVGYYYSLYIVPKGEHANYKRGSRVLYASRLDGEIINWIDSRSVEFKYSQAEIIDFKNYLWIRNNYNIEVRETPPTSGHSFELLSSGS